MPQALSNNICKLYHLKVNVICMFKIDQVELPDIVNEDVEMHNVLFPIVEPYFSPEQPSPELKVLPEKCPSVHAISEVRSTVSL